MSNDSVETYQGKTIDECLEGKQRAAHSSHILAGVDMSWLTEATEEQLKEADKIAKETWKKEGKENDVSDYRCEETDGLEQKPDSKRSK